MQTIRFDQTFIHSASPFLYFLLTFIDYKMDSQMQMDQKPSESQMYQMQSGQFKLSPDQALYINSLLPLGYSLQVAKTISKKSKDYPSLPKKQQRKKVEAKDPPEDIQPRIIKKSRVSRNMASLSSAADLLSHYTQNAHPSNVEVELEPQMKICFGIINKLKRSEAAEPFLEPVDPEALGIPDYRKIIKDPVDLSLVEYNLRNNLYQTPTQFHADLSKIFGNSYLYNNKGTEVYRMTVQLQRYYNKLMSEIEKNQNANELFNRLVATNRRVADYISSYAPKKKKKGQISTLSSTQINQLSVLIKQTPKTAAAELLKIIAENRSGSGQLIRNIQELDLHQLEPEVLVELDRFVRLKISPNHMKMDSKIKNTISEPPIEQVKSKQKSSHNTPDLDPQIEYKGVF